MVAVEPHRVMEGGLSPFDADDLAEQIQTGLREAGYAIHDVRRCIRLTGADEVGRPMTDAELAAVGITASEGAT